MATDLAVLGKGLDGVDVVAAHLGEVAAVREDTGLGGAHGDTLAAADAGVLVVAEALFVELDGAQRAAGDAGAALDAVVREVLEQVGVHVDGGGAGAVGSLEAAQVAAAVAVAHAHDVDVLHAERLGNHRVGDAVLDHGDGLVLGDIAADADLVEVLSELAEGEAGLDQAKIALKTAEAKLILLIFVFKKVILTL